MALAPTKPIKCPECKKGRIIDVFMDVDENQICFGVPLGKENPVFFVKCPKCGNQVAISLKNT